MWIHVHRDDERESFIGQYRMSVVPVPGDELVLGNDERDAMYKVVRRRVVVYDEAPTVVRIWVEKITRD